MLGSLDALAFDKTGTLTEGRPRITDVLPAIGVDVAELMTIAVAVERLSDHPLAEAIARDGVRFLNGRPVPAAADLASLTGREIGRAHVCTPVTNAHLVCRLLLEKKKK